MSNYTFTFKFIVVGDTGVGKTCLACRYTDNIFYSDHLITVGVEYGSRIECVQSNDEKHETNAKIQVWDTAGQEGFKSITRAYYRNAACAIVVFDVTNKKSFESARQCIQEIKEYSPHALLMLVGNKTDIHSVEDSEISMEEIKKISETYDMPFMETSAKRNRGVQELFQFCARRTYQAILSGKLKQNETEGIRKVNMSSTATPRFKQCPYCIV